MNAENIASDPHSLDFYETVYQGEAAEAAWAIDDAQPRVKELAALGALQGRILETGCGTGSNTIYLTKLGYDVIGTDGAPSAIKLAAERAREAGVPAAFAVADATRLDGHKGAFDTVFETGLYHCLDEDARRAYAVAVHRATSPGARWFILCFGDHNVNGMVSPLAPGEANIRETLTVAGWRIDHIGPTTYQFKLKNMLKIAQGSSAEQLAAHFPPEFGKKRQLMADRTKAIAAMLDEDDVITVPGQAVYATRV